MNWSANIFGKPPRIPMPLGMGNVNKEGSILTYSYLAYENGVCTWVSYRLNMNVGEVKYNSLNGVVRFEGYFEKILGSNVCN